jgi:hypothetical protein
MRTIRSSIIYSSFFLEYMHEFLMILQIESDDFPQQNAFLIMQTEHFPWPKK